MFRLTSKTHNMDSVYLQAMRHFHSSNRTICTWQLTQMCGYWPSLLNYSAYTNAEIDFLKTNPGQIPSLMDYFILMVHGDLFMLYSRDTLLKMMRANWPSLFNSTEYTNAKIDVPMTNPGQIPSLLDLVIPVPMGYSDPFMWNTSNRQPKQNRRQPKALNKPQQRNANSAGPKSNPEKKTSLCNPDKSSSRADKLKLNPEVKELKPTQRNGSSVSNKAQNVHNKQKTGANKPVIHPTSNPNKSTSYTILKRNNKLIEVQPNGENIPLSCDDIQLKQTPAKEECALICENTNQNIASLSGTVESEDFTLSEQNRQAIPATNTLIVDANNPKQPSAVCSVSSDANYHFGNWNTEVISGSPPLQQSHMPEGQTPRQNRMARMLDQHQLRPRLYIHTNTHQNNNVNTDSSFLHGGHLPPNSNKDVFLPEILGELESDEGPVTPELYKSKDESFVWNWSQAPMPWIIEGSGEDDAGTTSERRVAQVDDLPLVLEMTITEFVEMVEETFKEPDFGEAEACGNEQPDVNNRIATDNNRISLTMDQTEHSRRQTMVASGYDLTVGGSAQVRTIASSVDNACSFPGIG